MHHDVTHIRKKRAFKRRLYSKLVLIVLLLIFIFVLRGAWDIFQKSQVSKEKLERTQAEFEQVEAKRVNLEADLERLKTETGIEAEIRSKFDVAREGERVIVLIEGDEATTTAEQKPEGLRGFFTTIFSWFQ